MEFPDLDELEWLEANQQEEDYPVDEDGEANSNGSQSEIEGKHKMEDEQFKLEEDEEEEGEEEEVAAAVRCELPPINEKKRSRFQAEIEDDDVNYARVRVSSVSTTSQENDDDDKYLSCYASEINGVCVPITAPSGRGCGCGERVYARLDQQIIPVAKKLNLSALGSGGLTSEPVSLLLQNAEQDAMLKAIQATSQVQNALLPPETSVVTEQLWVNKYAPRSFTDLLSDEQTNREVLSWLKQWDLAVFGDGIKNTGDEVLSALRRHSSLSLHQKNSSASFLGKSRGSSCVGKYMGNSPVSGQEINRVKCSDSFQSKMQSGSGTPDQKVLLLCGPPGLGKTTLAHVAAKHCGYHVMEINASDDRSSTTIEAKILDAVQMNSVMAHSKPKCLVIDEIDGALGDGKGAVEVILKMVADGKKSYLRNDTLEEQYGRKSTKGRKSMSLPRPVICICNDLYAPSLRLLRHVAKVHVFSQPTLNRVVNRLKYVCNREGMKTSSTALTALAEYTGCDIRSCLNTLQFLHKKKESLNLVSLSSQVIGCKDMARSIFDVWKEVFQKRNLKRSRTTDTSQRQTHDAFDSLYSLVCNRGDYELLFDGIHENFLKLHYHDPVLLKTVHCLDALVDSDLLHQCVIHSHNMFLSAYLPFITITIHQLLARVESPSIEWPKSFHRYRLGLMGNMDKLKSWQSRVAPCISRHLSMNSFVEDTLSPLLDILSPADLRPVAVHLLSEKEKHDLARLVSIMVSYSLTYKNIKFDSLASKSALDGIMDAASSLSLDPPISGFVNFKGYKAGHNELTSSLKQVLMHEVEKQKIVQESIGRVMHSTHSCKVDVNAANDKENGTPNSCKVHEAACDLYDKGKEKIMLQKDICKGDVRRSLGYSKSSADAIKQNFTEDLKKPSIASFNFFDRFKKLSREGCDIVDRSEEKLSGREREGHRLLFKFNEGFTNAVKRPVRVREFLI